LKIKSFIKYFKKGLEIFQNFHAIFKYFKVKYFIVHLYVYGSLVPSAGKKVIYCKQIARQHSCQKIWQGQRTWL